MFGEGFCVCGLVGGGWMVVGSGFVVGGVVVGVVVTGGVVEGVVGGVYGV